eukprot:CAMPEP_0184645370 /NCGR_PEP_ID=MMETSP0308-20130426/1829_1 /TAXON_ID=38269 /ORGANISM="Gloeochaete witrockiana, Strain SAG 46.84" /LENGTH=158 /DNA_ID=CAMNT_0027074297 /DNA_START=367 /DNA_END=843 /DNA_ORIENTATION=-
MRRRSSAAEAPSVAEKSLHSTTEGKKKSPMEFLSTALRNLHEGRQRLKSVLAASRKSSSSSSAANSGPYVLGAGIPGIFVSIFGNFLQIYLFLLTVRVVLTWLPNVEDSPPIEFLRSITDPYLNTFRGLIPPIGGIDISPILAFLLLQFLQSLVQPTM